MVDDINIRIHIDDSELKTAKAEAEEYEEETPKMIEDVETKAKVSFRQVMLMARGAYMLTAGIIRATGGTVSTMFRMAISAFISAAAVMYPLLSAQAMLPGQQIQAGIGIGNLMIALMAIEAARTQQEGMARQLMAINTSLHGMSMMLGSYYS